MVRKTTEMLNLECVLTDEETLKYAKEMAEATNKLNQLEDSKKSYNSQIKSEIDSAAAKVNLLSRKVASGKEYRDIECDIVYDWDEKVKRFYRKDTGEFVRECIISEYELQEEMELQARAKEEADKREAEADAQAENDAEFEAEAGRYV